MTLLFYFSIFCNCKNITSITCVGMQPAINKYWSYLFMHFQLQLNVKLAIVMKVMLNRFIISWEYTVQFMKHLCEETDARILLSEYFGNYAFLIRSVVIFWSEWPIFDHGINWSIDWNVQLKEIQQNTECTLISLF